MKYIVYYPGELLSKVVAGARIARWLAVNLLRPEDVILLSDDTPPYVGEIGPYNLLFINLPKTMIRDVKAAEDLIRGAEKCVWIQNDYTVYSPTPETKGRSLLTCAFTDRIEAGKPTFGWTTCANRVDEFPHHYFYINWNALAYTPITADVKLHTDKVFYWGAYREGRAADFYRYMDQGGEHFVLSAPKRAVTKFEEKFKFAAVLDLINIPVDLAPWAMTLYLEDDMSHRRFHSPANRFYEALSANMAILVDSQAVDTLRRAGYSVPNECLVHGHQSMIKAMPNWEKIRDMQRTWHEDPLTGMHHQDAVRARLHELVQQLEAQP